MVGSLNCLPHMSFGFGSPAATNPLQQVHPGARARRKRRARAVALAALLSWAAALLVLLRASTSSSSLSRAAAGSPAPGSAYGRSLESVSASAWRAGAVRIDAPPSSRLCGTHVEQSASGPVDEAEEDFSTWRVPPEWAPSPAEQRTNLRIAVFTGAYSHIRDGVSLTLNRLVAFLQQCGHEVLVLAPTSAEPALHHAGNLTPVPSLPAPGRPDYRVSLGLTSALKDELASFNPNLVHIATPDVLGFHAQSWASQSHVPVVCSYHTHFAHYLHYYHLEALVPSSWRLLQAFYNSCKHTYVPTTGVANELAAHGITSSKLRVWGRGLDYSAFNPVHRCERWRQLVLRADSKTPVLLLVCRLVWEKALDVFADTVTELCKRKVRFKPVVVGDGPALQGLSQLIPGASFLGALKGADLARAYASSDVFLFPSLTETFGITTLEAMGSGLPAVVANSSAATGMVVHGSTGYVVAEQAANAYAQSAQALLQNPSLRKQMGENARQHAIKHFQWGKAFRELLDNYERAVIGNECTRSANHSAYASGNGECGSARTKSRSLRGARGVAADASTRDR